MMKTNGSPQSLDSRARRLRQLALSAGVELGAALAALPWLRMGTDNSGFGASPAVWDDYSTFPLVVQTMRRRGFSVQEIRKIAGGNYVRLFDQSVRA